MLLSWRHYDRSDARLHFSPSAEHLYLAWFGAQVAQELPIDFSTQQFVQLAIVGIVVSALLVFNRLLLSRGLNRGLRPFATFALTRSLPNIDLVLSRWTEVAIDLMIVGVGAVASLSIVDIEVGWGTPWARSIGLAILNWLRTHGVSIVFILALGFLATRAVRSSIGPMVRGAVTRNKTGVDLDEANKRATALAQVLEHGSVRSQVTRHQHAIGPLPH